MKLLRALTHALIILAIALISSAFATRGIALILRHVSFGAFLPLAFSTAACINNQRGLLVATLALTIAAVIPCSVQHLAEALVPIGAGVLLGVAINRALTETQEVPSG
ncbi:MAG: hypothetical protein ACSLFQ_02060 [Thermoanaerobaculia bacterium]